MMRGCPPQAGADAAHVAELKTSTTTENETVVKRLKECTDLAVKRNCVGYAIVMVDRAGTTFVSSFGKGNRVLLLGAIADLQHTIATDGDER